MRKMFLVFLLFCSISVFGQDSLAVKSKIDTAKIVDIKDEMFFTLAPRLGIGIHHNPFFEVGASVIHIDVHHLEFNATSVYGAMIFHQTTKNSSFDTYGFKVGFQSSWGIFMWGIETKYLFFEKGSEYYIPLKLGLSFLDVLTIEYGVNLAKITDDMVISTRHQVGLNFSFNKKIYRTIKKFN